MIQFVVLCFLSATDAGAEILKSKIKLSYQ